MKYIKKTKKIKAKILTYPTIKRYETLILHSKEQIKDIQYSLKVSQALKEYNIVDKEDLSDIQCDKTKKFLQNIGSDINNWLPRRSHKNFKEISIPYLQKDKATDTELSTYLKELQKLGGKYSINKPTSEQLESMKYIISHETIEVESLSYNDPEPQIDTLFQSVKYQVSQSVPNILAESYYYELKLHEANDNNWRKYSSENKEILTKEQAQELYEGQINTLKKEIEVHEKLIELIQDVLFEVQKKKGVLRPNSYFNSQDPYAKELTIYELNNVKNNETRIFKLLEKEAPLEFAKLYEAKENLEDIYQSIITFIIGKKLSKKASIALKAFTALVYKEYFYGKVDSLGCKATVKASDFWKLCNIPYQIKDGYDSRGKEAIKLVIQEELKKEIFYEDKKSFFITSFIHFFAWNDDGTFTFQIEDMFLVHKDSKELSYYYSDLEGCNRLMTKMPQSDTAYWLHQYLEHSIKKDEHAFNFSLLIEHAGLAERYQVAKNRTVDLLHKILDTMISEHTLIYKWELVPSKSDEEGKFILYNLRSKDKIVDINSHKNNVNITDKR